MTYRTSGQWRTDVLPWRKPQEAAPASAAPTLSIADLEKISEKVEVIAERVNEQQKSAEQSQLSALREHIRTF